MNFLTIFVFAFLGVALIIGIISICKINRLNEQEIEETEVMKNELFEKEAEENRNN